MEKRKLSLDALDISRTLARGFVLATDTQGRALRDAAQLKQGDEVRLHFARGRARARIEDVDKQN